MATLAVTGDELVVALSGWEKAGALHGDIRVPLTGVAGARVSTQPFADLRGVRAPGTGLPRVIALGTWRHRDGKDFAALYRHRPAVIVELRDGPFARLLVSVDDPGAVARAIGDRLPAMP